LYFDNVKEYYALATMRNCAGA